MSAALFKCSGAGKSKVVLEPTIAVRFELRADVDNGVMRLRVRNLERLGAVEYSFPPERVTEELMEELGKRMLAKPNRFKALSGDMMDVTNRDALKSEIARDQRRKKAELGGILSKLGWWLGECVRKVAGRC